MTGKRIDRQEITQTWMGWSKELKPLYTGCQLSGALELAFYVFGCFMGIFVCHPPVPSEQPGVELPLASRRRLQLLTLKIFAIVITGT